MKKVSELTGAELDVWVLKSQHGALERGHGRRSDWADVYVNELKYHPSTDWNIGGLIIEREKISLVERGDHWVADMRGTYPISGKTPLIAAMRCYVASVYGESVGD